MKNPFKTLKGTMILSLILILIIPLMVVSFIISSTIVSELSKTVVEENEAITKAIALHVEHFFHKHEELLNSISYYYIENPDCLHTEDVLESSVNGYGTLELALILDSEGKIIFSSDKNRAKIGFDMSRQPFFIGAMDSDGFFWSSPFIDPITGHTTVTVSKKFDDFVIAAYVIVKDLTSLLGDIGYNIASAAIIDNYGTVVAHSNPVKAERRENVSDNGHYQKARTLGPGTYESDCGTRLASFFPVGDTGWFTMITVDKSVINKPVRNSQFILFLSIIIIGLAEIAFVIYITNRIVNSTKRLSKQSGEVARGNYSTKIQQTRFAEFNELIENFNLMTNSIKEREEELIETNEEMKRVNKELEAFSYSVSHDLRAPLRYVVGFSEALKEDCGDSLDDLGRGYLDKICDSARDMGTLINDILKLSRVTRGELNKREINLSNMVKSILDYLKREEPDRKVELKIQKNVFAFADENLIHVALENLLGNAWKFSRNEEKAVIQFGSKEENGERVFYIKDNGAGFDGEYVDTIFEPFHRLHKTSEFEGTGIGTSLVKRVIMRHGGKLWAEGEVGKGATFYFTIKERGEEDG